MATKRQKQQSKKIAEQMGFPTTLPECPTTDDRGEIDSAIMYALNWLNVSANHQKERAWACAYMKEEKLFTGTELAKIKVIDKALFNRFGRYCLMLMNGYPKDGWVEKYIDSGMCRIQKQLNKKPKPVVKVVDIQEKINNKATEKCGDALHMIDEFIDTIHKRKKSEDLSFMDFSSWIETNDVKGKIASKMIPILEEDKSQYTVALNDKQVRSAYPQFTDSQLKRVILFYESFIDSLTEKKVQKKTQKPRRKKVVSPVKLTQNVKYLLETKDFGGIKSIQPSKIVGASRLVIVNTKTRIYTIFESEEKNGLTIKGTTVYNFDTKKSVSKKIREQYLEDLVKTSKNEGIRNIRNKYNSIKSKEFVPNGRINGDCIIIRAL